MEIKSSLSNDELLTEMKEIIKNLKSNENVSKYRKRYPTRLKHLVSMAVERGVSKNEVSKTISVSDYTITNWCKQHKSIVKPLAVVADENLKFKEATREITDVKINDQAEIHIGKSVKISMSVDLLSHSLLTRLASI